MKWWLAILVPLWVTLVLCTHWEPVQRDGWANSYWHHTTDLSPATIWHFIYDESWLISNPRIGRLFTLLLYTPGPWSSIFSPLVELAMFGLLTALALGRWPSRKPDDALVFVTIVAMACACIPELGPMLFYRAFTGNYLYGLVLELLWIVPYRFHVDAPREPRLWWAPVMFVLGVLAGLSNEHTVPAFAVAAGLGCILFVRRGERLAPWMIAGLVGLVAGYLLLMFAPGQQLRYDGLATQQTIIQRIVERGLAADLKILWRPAYLMLLCAPWLALGALGRGTFTRNQKLSLFAIAGAAVVILLMLLGSPKQGARLDFAAMVLAIAAIAGWVVARLSARWMRIACAALGGAVAALACVVAVVIYHAIGDPGVRRAELMLAAKPGDTVVIPALPAGRSRWFLGDEFAEAFTRKDIAGNYHLAAIELEP